MVEKTNGREPATLENKRTVKPDHEGRCAASSDQPDEQRGINHQH